VAKPAQRRSFTAPGAGWVVVSDGDADRWLLDSASVRAKGAGIYAATVRVENGAPQPGPVGRMDAVRMQFDVDCVGVRARITGVTAMLQGREVGSIPVPPARTAWTQPGDGNLVIAAVCRLAPDRRP
jgi:hypothetical protein